MLVPSTSEVEIERSSYESSTSLGLFAYFRDPGVTSSPSPNLTNSSRELHLTINILVNTEIGHKPRIFSHGQSNGLAFRMMA
jgi:hypothetical protein